MMRHLFVLVCLMQLFGITLASNHTDIACIDGQLSGAIDYDFIAKYQTIHREENKTYACSLITQCSMDRLANGRLASQIKGWQGAASVAVYIPTPNPLEKLHNMYTVDKFLVDLQKDPDYNGRLTVSLLFGHEGTPELWNCPEADAPGYPLYPINALRNLAVAAATGVDSHNQTTPTYILYLDVDFVPSAGLSDWVDQQHHANGTFNELMSKHALFVVPAFESSAAVPLTPTRNLQYLLQGIRDDKIHQFHGGKRYPAGHNMTDFHRWKSLSMSLDANSSAYAFDAYKVQFQQGAEPYVIMAMDTFLPYDERFRGYGLNKCVNLKWHAEFKRSFYVQPGHFIVEDKHANSKYVNRAGKTARLLQDLYNVVRTEISAGRLPLVSYNASQALIAAGYEKVATEVPAVHEAFWSRSNHSLEQVQIPATTHRYLNELRSYWTYLRTVV